MPGSVDRIGQSRWTEAIGKGTLNSVAPMAMRCLALSDKDFIRRGKAISKLVVPSALRGASLKLERAARLVDDLRSEVAQFLEPRPYRVDWEEDPATGDRLYRVSFQVSPPERLSPIIGDCVHNLRSSLDHMVSAVARQAGIGDDKISFPACTDPADWGRHRKVQALPYAARNVIESLQPYHSDEPHDYVLSVLHQLWNHDKHRDIVLTGACLSRADRHHGAPGTIPSITPGIIDDGVVVLREPPPREPNFDVSIGFDVAFGQGNPRAVVGMSVTKLLSLIMDEWIGDLVLPKFIDLFGDVG